MDKIKLFCLPYAGGSATLYRQWINMLDNSIELRPVELKGRGSRFNESFYNGFQDAVDDIFEIIKPEIENSQYALFGHSMGSLIVFDLLKKIRSCKCNQPLNVFFSGRYPPHISKNKMLHLLPDEEFKKAIIDWGGTPAEVFEDRMLRETYVPVIRSDFKMIETRGHVPDSEPYNFDITILCGTVDEIVSLDEAAQWKDYTAKECNYFYFEGGHFFINEKTEEVVSAVNKTLLNYTSKLM